MMFFRIGVVVGLAAMLTASQARAAAQDFKVLDGVLVQAVTLPADDVAVVAGESDGVIYYIDLRGLPRTPLRLEARTSVSIIGYEGERPNQLAAHVVNVRQPVPFEPRVEPRASVDLRTIEGQVQSVSRDSLKLRTQDGRTVNVRIRELITSWHAFVKGETLKVLGVLDGWETFAAHAVIHYPPPAAASTTDKPAGSAR